MIENITSGDIARKKLQEGVNILANAVRATLGPKGRNVIIYDQCSTPHITKDGVTVAKHIVLRDKLCDAGAQIIKQAASKTNDNVGDGTTTSTIIACELINGGIELINKGYDPIEIKRIINEVADIAIKQLNDISIPIDENYELLKYVSVISSNNDNVLGELVAETVKNVKGEGSIVVEESKHIDTYVAYSAGMKFDRGYLSHHFINHNNKEIVVDKPYILLTDHKVGNIKDIKNIINDVFAEDRPLVIFAKDFSDQVINELIYHHINNFGTVIPIKAPGFGTYQNQMLSDIAIATNSTVIWSQTNARLNQVQLDNLGVAEKITVDKENTIIVNNRESEEINNRIEDLKQELKTCEKQFEKEKLVERIARLSGGVAVIYVGGATEAEIKEKKDRVDDAVCATKAALQEGIVVGGGRTLFNIAEHLKDQIEAEAFTEKEQEIVTMFMRAICAPMKQILKNAGKDYNECVEYILANDNKNYGYNANLEAFDDLFEAGVIDAVKVTKTAIINAVSAATTLLLTEYLITEENENSI